MGCRCDSVKGINAGEYNFDEEPNNSSNIIVAKKKSISTKSNLHEIENAQIKFTEELKDKKDYEILKDFNIKEYLTHECMEAIKIFTDENQKFSEIYEKYDLDENKELKQEINSNNESEKNYKIIKMPPIKYTKNNSIYEGGFFYDEINKQFSYGGDGILITSKKEFIEIKNQSKNSEYIENGRIFYPNGDIYIGTITKEEPYSKIKGILFENVNGNYDNYIQSKNFNDNKPYIIKHFSNGDIYKGESILKNNKFNLNGKGQLTNKKHNSIFKGNFSRNLYNGRGELFKPLGGLSEQYNIDENIGKTIISNWINGKPNGKGLIKERYSIDDNTKSTTCSFRFGKIIKYTSCLIKNKVKLNENIFNFLTLKEISNIMKNMKTKSLLNYLKNNNNFNFNKIKIYNALNKYDIGNYKKDLFNNELFKLNIKNFNDVMNNILDNKFNFLPFVCYRSDGGEVENRYRPYNIFNPDSNKIYSTNYLTHKDSNITISGIFNKNLYENYQMREGQLYDLEEDILYNLMKMSSLYKPLYDKFESNYPVRIINTDIIEYNKYILSNNIIGNINNILCTIQYITIFVPIKKDDFTVLINPCYFLSVYIGNYNNNNQSIIGDINEINTNSKQFIDINDEEIKENKYNLKLIKDKYNKYIINEEINNNFEYIEFDTNIQKEYEYKLLCLVKIKEKNESNEPYIINLKKFYHTGNVANIKLINQLNIYNKNQRGYSIDFGTINFYGDIIYFN